MNQLAQEVKPRLCAYFYRVTLDQELTQDLSQEAMLSMVKSLNSLQRADRFWPWLYRIAQSKMQQHYRDKQKKAAITETAMNEQILARHNKHHQDDGLHRVLQKELSKKVVLAIKQLRHQYRAVLSLRCFEQLSYADIALALDCSEVKARVVFFRAKQALKKQLTKQGLSRNMLLTCLGLYGKLTAPADGASTAVTVTSASTKVGLTAAMISTAGTKVGVTTVVVALAGLATVGGIRTMYEPGLPSPNAVRSVHFTMQSRDRQYGPNSSLSKGAYEQWFYFLEGPNGPMFLRMQRWDPQEQNKLCAWLQNADANYYFESGSKTIHIVNYRLWFSSLRVRHLPTDSAALTRFLSQVQGEGSDLTLARDQKTGLVVELADNRFIDAPGFRSNYDYNTLDESFFEYDWPNTVPIEDHRDQMHKRGWTYFRVNGHVNSRAINGRGRIPFVYAAYKQHQPWMTLRIGQDLLIVDCNSCSYLREPDGAAIAAYRPETFFSGLGRPWMGMHTINILRRDAGKQRIWFAVTPVEDGEDMLLEMAHEHNGTDKSIIYTLDMLNDLVKSIEFQENGRTVGKLAFSYLQGIDFVAHEFAEPTAPQDAQAPMRRSPGMRWLVDLANGNLGS
jgi:RNA polymerase sigma-70 factor (ECF subfamily)